MRPSPSRRAALGAGLLAALPVAARAEPSAIPATIDPAGDGRLLALAAALRGAHAREMEAVQVLMRAEAARDERATARAAAASHAAFDARTDLMDGVAGIPAEGLAGLAAKAALVCRALEHGPTRADCRLADSLLADVARLVPEATA